MSNESGAPVLLHPAVGTVTHALVAHANGDHQPDERGPQADCPSCKAEHS